MRSDAIVKLMDSVMNQTLYPNEILVVDGSYDDKTAHVLSRKEYKNLHYFKVSDTNRGLTKQRNYGISKLNPTSEVVCFLDDDTVLKENYFEEIIITYLNDKTITGVGGIAVNENRWQKKQGDKKYNSYKYYELDGYVVKEGLRNRVRNYLGLQSNLKPGVMPSYSHGRTCSYPLNTKVYEVDLLIGMSFSFRKKVVDTIKFSTYFEGYGLYEDADFSIRALAFGKNVIATSAQLDHFHDSSGRPSKFRYGKMVVRNGWYIWRIKCPRPDLKSKLKWNLIMVLHITIIFTNIFRRPNRWQNFTEMMGRIIGMGSLLMARPKIK